MVGGERDPGGAAAELTATLRDAYHAAAPAWADGAERVYLPLAQALAAQAEVAGQLVRARRAAGRGRLRPGADPPGDCLHGGFRAS